MHTFKDKDGTEWILDLSMARAMEIEGYDFGQALGDYDPETRGYNPRYIKFINPEESSFQTYLHDSKMNFTIVWILCRKQAEQRGVNNMLEFAERFDGEAIDRSRIALWEEMANFFQGQKTMLRTLIEHYSKNRAEADQRISKILARKMPKLFSEAIDELEVETESIGKPSG